MHELSLAQSIVRSAQSVARQHGRELRGVNLAVGSLSSVSLPTLEFCMRLVLEQEGLEGVSVRVREVRARARCACGEEYVADDLFTGCPRCGGFERDVVDGQDVVVESIEVEDGQDKG